MSTSTGPKLNQASPTASGLRLSAAPPRSAWAEAVSTVAAATNTGTSGVGSSSSIGTKTICVGTAFPVSPQTSTAPTTA